MKHVSTVTRFFHCPMGGFVLAWQSTQNDRSSSSVFRIHARGNVLEISREVFCVLIHGRSFKLNSENVARTVATSPVLGATDFTLSQAHYWEE